MPQLNQAIRMEASHNYVLGISTDEFDSMYARGMRQWKNISLTNEKGEKFWHDIQLTNLRREADGKVIFAGYLFTDDDRFNFIGISAPPERSITLQFSLASRGVAAH